MAVEIEIAGSFGGGSQVVCGSKYAESAGQARRAVADIGFVQRQPVALMNPEHIVGTPVDRRMPAEHVGAGGVAWLREAFVASGNRGRARSEERRVGKECADVYISVGAVALKKKK